MSESGVGWTTSQKIAFPLIESGVSRGLSATEALSQYRAGGGKIRDAYWYSLYKQTFEQQGIREKVTEIPITYTVPEQMFDPRDWDLTGKYAMQMKVTGKLVETGERITKWVTVESDELLTKAEWRDYAQDALFDTIGSPDMEIDGFLEYSPIMRISR